jgi:hypothetical protein
MTHNNAFKKNAPTNGLLAKKTLNASQPFKTVKRNAELSNRAGNSVFPLKEVKLPLMLPNALLLITAFNLKYSLMHLKHACPKHAQILSQNVLLIKIAEPTLEFVETLKKFGTSLSNA